MNYHIKCSECPRLADTHTSAVACGSLSQSCQWLSLVRQTELTKVHFKTWELVLASVAAFVKSPALSTNLIIQCIEVEGISDSVITVVVMCV